MTQCIEVSAQGLFLSAFMLFMVIIVILGLGFAMGRSSAVYGEEDQE